MDYQYTLYLSNTGIRGRYTCCILRISVAMAAAVLLIFMVTDESHNTEYDELSSQLVRNITSDHTNDHGTKNNVVRVNIKQYFEVRYHKKDLYVCNFDQGALTGIPNPKSKYISLHESDHVSYHIDMTQDLQLLYSLAIPISKTIDNCDVIFINGAAGENKRSLLSTVQARVTVANLVLTYNCGEIAATWAGYLNDSDLHYAPSQKEGFTDSLSPEPRSDWCAGTFRPGYDAILPVIQANTRVFEPRLKHLYDEIVELDRMGVEGDLVECGVWLGGASMLMAYSTVKQRDIWLYDTFEGMTEPNHEFDDEKSKTKWAAINAVKENMSDYSQKEAWVDEHGIKRWAYGPIDLVEKNMNMTGRKFHLIKGKVEDTLNSDMTLPKRIAVLRLDTDFFVSTKAELDVLYQYLVPGGLLIIDDYCTYGGSTKATDMYRAKEEFCDIHDKGEKCFWARKCRN